MRGSSSRAGKTTWKRVLAVAGLALVAAACGDDRGGDGGASATTAGAAAAPTTAASEGTEGGAAAPTTAASEGTEGGGETPAATGEGISLAVNPWTGSAVNSHLAKIVLESELGTPVELVDIDENATWPGMDAGDLDAVLEVWASGHAEDYATYIEGEASVVDMGPLGPEAQIGWWVPSYVIEEYPELATWEGLKDPETASIFATAETGDQGQFLLGDPSWVSYDEQIIANLELPLDFVVAGSEAAVLTAVEQAVAAQEPLLFYFWTPHWIHGDVDLTMIELPEVTEECMASAEAEDGNYECGYPVDVLYKAASAGLEEKNPVAFEFIQNFELTIEQQNEIAAMIDGEGMDPAAAAQQWIDDNPDVVEAWLA